jgi:hypothetical protein
MRGAVVLLALGACVSSCKSRAETERSPAQIASSLLGDHREPVQRDNSSRGVEDLSPLDSASALPAAPKQVPWQPAFCEVVPEAEQGASFSDLNVDGTCRFHYVARAECRGKADDYYAILERKLSGGYSLEVYINVEFYTGPGTYDRKVEILALVRRGLSLYRWSNQHASATLGFGEGGLSTSDPDAKQAEASTPTRVELPPIELAAEPGTATSGTITLSGSIGCKHRKRPGH